MNVVLLLEATQPSEKQRPLIDILSRSSQNLLELINGVLDYSRLEAGKLPLDKKPFSLRAMLEQVTANFTTRAAEKGVAFEVLADEEVPETLVGDSVKLGEVLMNLAGNALKFTDRGQVRVSVTCPERSATLATLRFAVSDTGIGIEHDRLPHIFDEFTQADAEIGLKYGGTGLGLAIGRKLLALLGSEMRVDSTPGQGSTFSFEVSLPLGGEAPT
jgi:signal transduction histidine kinase